MNSDDMKRLQAASLHEHEGEQSPIEIQSSKLIRNDIDFTMLKTQPHPLGTAIHLAVNVEAAWLWPVDDNGHFGPTMKKEDIDHWIALLQRAQQIMRGES